MSKHFHLPCFWIWRGVCRKLYNKVKKTEIRKIASYLIVGGATLVLYYFLLWSLFDLFKLNYQVAVTFSYLLASAFHFLANRNVTFKSGNGNCKRQIYCYLLVAFLNYLIQLGVINILYELLGLNLYISAFIGIFITVIVGFTLLNNWVFRGGNDNSS